MGKTIAVSALLAVVAVLLVWLAVHPNTQPTGPRDTSEAPPASDPAQVADIPTVHFTDITTEAGIDFVHENGAYGEKLLPETMGGGAAFFDADQDGDPDLLLINSSYWPWDPAGTNRPLPTLAFYENAGGGRFTNVTARAGLGLSLYGMGVAVGDYDNDGRVDVYVTALGSNRLLRNLGQNRFGDVTDSAGVGGEPGAWSTSAAFFDYDNDGDLDLFVCRYVQWSRERDLKADYQLPGLGRAYGPPVDFPGSFPKLFRNDGQGRFSDVSSAAGIEMVTPATGGPMAKSLGVAPVDVDNDGWLDLVVANDTVQNFVFQNQRNGTFKEIGRPSGIAFDSYGQTRGAMGIDAARFRNNEALGIAIGNFANEMNALYVSQPSPLVFADEAATEGVGHASALLLKFGLFFFDYDLDGQLDVLTANGHLEEDIQKVQPTQRYRQPAQLFWNRGPRPGPRFATVPPDKSGPDLIQPIVGRGSAYADIDNDGDLDVILTQVRGRPLLLRNDQRLGHRWLRLRLVGTTANRDAIGAWVHARLGSQTLSRQVMPTRGYLSQSELPVTLGLGRSAGSFDSLEIRWPNGSTQKLPVPPLGQTTVVTQAK